MAALSYYSNFDAPFQQVNSNISTLYVPPQTELLSELSFNIENSYCGHFENLFDPNDIFQFDEYCNHQTLDYPPDQNNMITFDEPFMLKQEFEPLSKYPKIQNPNFGYDEVTLFSQQALFNDELLVPNHYPNLPEHFLSPEITKTPPTLPAFPNGPPVFSHGSSEQSSKKQSVSPQSLAARQRRRKITEKTQELGKLIPGAHKMNTAEMFQAAYKYIKFLQAQTGILQFSESYNPTQENVTGKFQSEEMRNLLESTIVQEKLYSTENCLVPKKLVQELSFDEEMFKSKPQVFKEVRQLLN